MQRVRGETKQYRCQRVWVGAIKGNLSGGSVSAASGTAFATLAEWMDAVDRINTQEQGGFWSNIGAVAPKVSRVRDRVFVGSAAVFPASRSSAAVNANETWIPSSEAGAAWAPRDSQFVVMHDVGGMAVTGMSKSSLGESTGLAWPPPPIGVSGFIINDSGQNKAAWALYADIQHEPASGNANSYGLEVAAKNKGADSAASPYGMGFGVYGLWLAGGGDNAYGGSAANPANSAIAIIKNDDHGWNRGIVFGADALTGADGSTGSATAIAMGKGHMIRWYFAGANVGATIRSDVAIGGRAMGMLFDSNIIYFSNNAGLGVTRFVNVDADAVNNPRLENAVAGSPVRYMAEGGDTNIDIGLVPKGSGTVRITTLPTSASGLATGSLWNDAGTVKVVT